MSLCGNGLTAVAEHWICNFCAVLHNWKGLLYKLSTRGIKLPGAVMSLCRLVRFSWMYDYHHLYFTLWWWKLYFWSDNNILELSILKWYANNKVKMLGFIFDEISNIVWNWENAGNQHFLLFKQCFLKSWFPEVKVWNCLVNSITRQQILDSSTLKEFADDHFKFDENSRKLSKRVENTVGKGKHCGKRRNCSLRAISPFPTVFSKGLFPRGVKKCHCVGMG